MGTDSLTVGDRLHPSFLSGPPARPALALPSHLHLVAVLSGKETGERQKGLEVLSCKGRDSHWVGSRGREALEEGSPAFEEDSVSRSPGVGKDSSLEGTFLPQLILSG